MSRNHHPPLRERGAGRLGLWVAMASSALVLWWTVYGLPYAVGAAEGYVVFRRDLGSYLQHFWGQEQWQHCWLVLPAIAFIVWSDRKKLAAIPAAGTWFGLSALLLGGLIYYVGYRVDNYYFGYLSIQVTVGGLILWFGGWKWMRALIFPFLFMFFLWPLHFFGLFKKICG